MIRYQIGQMNRFKNSNEKFELNDIFRKPKTPETKDDSIKKMFGKDLDRI